MTDITPARLRELADAARLDNPLGSTHAEWVVAVAAALRAAAERIDIDSRLLEEDRQDLLAAKKQQVEDDRRAGQLIAEIAQLERSLAAREALLKQAEGYVWIIGGLPEYMTVAERSTARSLAAEIAAALNEEKENG